MCHYILSKIVDVLLIFGLFVSVLDIRFENSLKMILNNVNVMSNCLNFFKKRVRRNEREATEFLHVKYRLTYGIYFLNVENT